MMQRRARWWLSIGCLLAACTAPGNSEARDRIEPAMSPAPGFAAAGERRLAATARVQDEGLDDFASDRTGQAATQSRTGVPAQAGQRMLIQRGRMRVEVARVDDAMATFLATVKDAGGYLAQQHGSEVAVRVPAERFEAIFASLRALGRVLDEAREAQDVTEEFVDVGIRLDNARKSRDRLIELLAKADKVEDMLKIEEQLRRLTEEIERLEGRRKLLADQVAMATITAAFESVAPIAPPQSMVARPSQFDWVRQLGAEQLLGGR